MVKVFSSRQYSKTLNANNFSFQFSMRIALDVLPMLAAKLELSPPSAGACREYVLQITFISGSSALLAESSNSHVTNMWHDIISHIFKQHIVFSTSSESEKNQVSDPASVRLEFNYVISVRIFGITLTRLLFHYGTFSCA